MANKASFAVQQNKDTNKNKLTAKHLLDKEVRESMVKLDEGYYILQCIRNCPPDFEAKKKEGMAMVHQLGMPTLFFFLYLQQTLIGQH